jgi:hypothetical protein
VNGADTYRTLEHPPHLQGEGDVLYYSAPFTNHYWRKKVKETVNLEYQTLSSLAKDGPKASLRDNSSSQILII